ncbi:hypothetical protein Ahy_B03g066800 isoform B [Arachis hypogaea]|uniref:Uncharacterized protein n=1 Tax=Arachis hypogaea TaxID=3818 RepID=A0A445A4V9_ARAHY|nr:hypothetical protein Ahy_B03g066800 isoform B [Arachis hypogaea]
MAPFLRCKHGRVSSIPTQKTSLATG